MTTDLLAAARNEHRRGPGPSITSAHRGCAVNTTATVLMQPTDMRTSMHAPPLHAYHCPPPHQATHHHHLCHSSNTHKTQTGVVLTTAAENTGSTKAMLITSTSCGNTKVVLFFNESSLCACLPAGDPCETRPHRLTPSKATEGN